MLQDVFGKLRSLVAGEEIAVEERRSVIRLRCMIPVMIELAPGQQMRANVTDIGLKGLRIEGLEGLKKGAEVSVHYAGPDLKAPNGSVRCRLLWSRRLARTGNTACGFEYCDRDENMARSWVRWSLEKLGFAQGKISERRKWMRVPSDVRVSLLSLQDEILTDCSLADLSMGGALVASNVHVEPKTRMRLLIGPAGSLKMLKVTVVVLATREDRQRRTFYLRTQFHGMEESDVRLLRKIIGYCKKAQA